MRFKIIENSSLSIIVLRSGARTFDIFVSRKHERI